MGVNGVDHVRPELPTRPRVLHVATSLHFGGVERVLTLTAAAAHSSSYEHSFLAISGGTVAADTIRSLGCRVSLLNNNPRIPSLLVIGRLVLEMIRHRPQLVHSHGAEANFHAMIAAWLARIPHRITEEIGIPSGSLAARLVFGLIHRIPQRTIAVSEATKEALTAMRLPTSRVVVVDQPGALTAYQPRKARGSSPFTLGFVGRLEPEKNPAALIEATHLLRNHGLNVKLLIVGDGSLLPELRRMIASTKLEDHVKLCGFELEPMEILQDSHLLVQPSLSEGLGLAVIEAMAAGIPVLVTPYGGTREFVDPDATGWVLDSLSPEDIAAKITALSSLPIDELNSVGESASAFVAERFAKEKYIHHLDEIYQTLLSNGAKGQQLNRN